MADSNGHSLKPGTPGVDYKGHLFHVEIGIKLYSAVLILGLVTLCCLVLLRCQA